MSSWTSRRTLTLQQSTKPVMNSILYHSSKYFYTDILMLISSLFCFFTCFKNRLKAKSIRFLFIYPLAAVCQTLIIILGIYNSSIPNSENNLRFINITINIFMLVEYAFFFSFFNYAIENKKLNQLNIKLLVFYTALTLFLFTKTGSISKSIPEFSYVQSVFVLTSSIICLIDLFKTDPIEDLFNKPSLWIILGATLYFLCTAPIQIAEKFIIQQNGNVSEAELYSINYLCYTLLFLLISRSFLCTPKQAQ